MTAAGKAYFRYHLRDKLKLLLFFVVLAMSLTFIFATDQRSDTYYYHEETKVLIEQFDWTVGTSFMILMVCGTILPVTEFSCFKKRRNLDCFYGLPITRKELGTVHYITGLICLIVPFSAGYFLNTMMMFRYPNAYCFSAVAGYYLVALFLAWCSYSLNVFVFNQANTAGDGIWFMILWNFLMSLAIVAINEVLPVRLYGETVVPDIPYSGQSIYWAFQGKILSVYKAVIEKGEGFSLWDFWCDLQYVLWFIGWAITGIASSFLFFRSFGKRRMEKAEEVSDSWFGFKVLIPLYGVIIIIGGTGAGIIGLLIVSFVGYLIYRRGFHLKLSDWICLVAMLLLDIAVFFVSYAIETITFNIF